MGTRILIVENASFMRTIVKNMLVPLGYIIAGEATSPSEAVDMYERMKPDLITIDVSTEQNKSKERVWIETVKKILARNPDARIVMVAAPEQEEMLIDSFKAGVRDFVVKPFEPERIITAVENAVA